MEKNVSISPNKIECPKCGQFSNYNWEIDCNSSDKNYKILLCRKCGEIIYFAEFNRGSSNNFKIFLKESK